VAQPIAAGPLAALLCLLYLWLGTAATTPALAGETAARVFYVSDIKAPGGVRLAADIYLPEGEGPFPTVLFRTPYDPRFKAGLETVGRLVRAGYAVVINQCRGRFDSGGEFYPFKHEAEDGYASMNWVARQGFCNGKVGTMGASYVGMDQWQLASKRHPAHKAMFVVVAPTELYSDIAYPGGAFSLEGNVRWLFLVSRRTDQNPLFTDWKAGLAHLPLIDMDRALGFVSPVMRDFLKHSRDGEFWRRLYSLSGKYAAVSCPTFIVGGWNDALVTGTLRSFDELSKIAAKKGTPVVRCLVGPWDHLGAIKGTRTVFGDVDFGPGASVDIDGLAVKWFDRWLKGVEQPDLQASPLRYFATGDNTWHEAGAWAGEAKGELKLYLRGPGPGGSARSGTLSAEAAGDEPPTSFVYDPENPVPTVTSQHLLFGSGYKWIDAIEGRDDMLIFTSEPLAAPTFVCGQPGVELFIQSDAPDTDFTAWLCEVDDKGRSLAIRDGVVRASRYLSRSANSVLAGGQIYKVRIDFGATAHVFKVGSRIRLDVSSSNFPAYDRNLNTGLENCLASAPRKATQSIHHSGAAPSALVLPTTEIKR